MPPFERLLRIALLQHEANDFPAHLLREVEDVFADAGALTGREALVEELATQIENFDPYAGVGCFDESCNAAAVATTLKRLKEGEV
jgi:hypothetical protein